MVKGIVKWVNPATGFGCIALEDNGADLFVSLSSVALELKEGQAVCFDVHDKDMIKQAVNIRLSDSHNDSVP